MRLVDFFDRGAALFPGRDVIRTETRRWTYHEMRRLTLRIANAVAATDLPLDATVASLTPNHPMAFAAQYGTLRAGPIWVPLNARNSTEENIATMARLDVRMLFFHSQYEADIPAIRAALPMLEFLVCLDGPSAHAPSIDAFADPFPERGDGLPEKGADDIVSMLTTSGTTGTPKGVMLSNLNWEAMVASYQLLMPYDAPPTDIVAAPMTHAAGAHAASLLSLGGTLVLLPKPDPLLVMQAIHEHRANTVFLPPTLIYTMLSHKRIHEFDYSSLRYFMYGTAPMSVQKLREAVAVFGPVMAQAFGQSEVPMAISYLSPQDHTAILADPALHHRLASAGRPCPLTRVAIMDDSGHLLPPGERGEIVVRSTLVMKGYYRDPEGTEAVSRFSWHHTGDIGVLDADHFLTIVDRKRDMIISGGFNVFPGEVEQVIWTHPSVQDCAVVGIPDSKWGEAVTAVLELKDGAAVTADEIIALCKSRLGSVKAPKHVEIWPSLPRSPVGKVLKREIRARFWAGQERVI